VTALPRQLHSDESGFTLPELLTAMGIGLIVLLAALLLLDTAVSTSNKLADRQDAAQRGRLAMEVVTRDLRSQVCLGEGKPITAGDPNGLTFYSNTTSNTDYADRRVLRYVASEKTLYEDIHAGSGTFPDLTFSGTPTTRRLLKPVARVTDGAVTRDMFRYYKFKPGGTPGELQQLSTPLTPTDAGDVVMIKAAFVALPDRNVESAKDVGDATSFETDIYVRLADPSKPLEGPRCL
jgi:prepilin-type N-terminal cleavage/methylation domain-containing protein